MRRNPAAAARRSQDRLSVCSAFLSEQLLPRFRFGREQLANFEFMATETNPVTIAAAHACWSCGDMRAAQFCTSCGKVQPPAPVDYFSFFGLPRKLNIDTAVLEREFYALSRQLHPDLYARSADQ